MEPTQTAVVVRDHMVPEQSWCACAGTTTWAVKCLGPAMVTALEARPESFGTEEFLALARAGQAPTIFGWVNNRGVPVPALVYVLLLRARKLINIKHPQIYQNVSPRLLPFLPDYHLGLRHRLHMANQPNRYIRPPRLVLHRLRLPPLPIHLVSTKSPSHRPPLHPTFLPTPTHKHNHTRHVDIHSGGV